MADGVVGVAVRSAFSTGVSETFTVNRAVYGVSTDFSGLISFVAGAVAGDWDIVFTPAAAGDYRARWTGNTSGEQFVGNWHVVTASQADPVAALAQVSSVVYISAPVSSRGDAEVTQGDDYLAANNRALTWTSTSWPTLTGATVNLKVWDRTGTLILTKAATVTPATPLVSVDLTRTETAALPIGGNRYAVVATLSGGAVATLARDILTVKPSPP